MDYRNFNVCMWSFLCVRIHTGVGHTDSESTQQFWLGKTHTSFLCSWRGWNLGHGIHWVSSRMLYKLSHPITPIRVRTVFSPQNLQTFNDFLRTFIREIKTKSRRQLCWLHEENRKMYFNARSMASSSVHSESIQKTVLGSHNRSPGVGRVPLFLDHFLAFGFCHMGGIVYIWSKKKTNHSDILSVYPYGFAAIPTLGAPRFRCYAGRVKNSGHGPSLPFLQFILE